MSDLINRLSDLCKSLDAGNNSISFSAVMTLLRESIHTLIAKDQRIAELEAALRDFPTIAKSAPALIKRIKTEFLPRRRKLLEASEDTRKEAPE